MVHRGDKIPSATVEVVRIDPPFYGLTINGIFVEALFATNEKQLERFVRIHKKYIDLYAYNGHVNSSNHSILEAIAGRKGTHQQDTRAQWKEHGVYLDYNEEQERMLIRNEKLLN